MAGLSLFQRRPAWFKGATALTTRWLESTLEIARWENMRKAGRRWGWWGVGLGSLVGILAYAPAPWLAQGVLSLTDGRLLLADSRGTVWRGDAVVVLTGGAGSRDARALPGRLNWRVSLGRGGLDVSLQQDCCITEPVALRLTPGWGRLRVAVVPSPGSQAERTGELARWPAAWLAGLGTPWNTLQLDGVARLSASGFGFEWVQGRVRLQGMAVVALDDVSSSLTTLDTLGSYRFEVRADGEGQAALSLRTEEGALSLSGQGEWRPAGVYFRGEARASEAERDALDNLLNIIGRREGERSVISIG